MLQIIILLIIAALVYAQYIGMRLLGKTLAVTLCFMFQALVTVILLLGIFYGFHPQPVEIIFLISIWFFVDYVMAYAKGNAQYVGVAFASLGTFALVSHFVAIFI